MGADPRCSTFIPGGAPSWTELWRSLVWRLRALLLGAGASAPTARDERWAVVALGAGLVWALICAVVAAALVAG